MTPHEQPTQAVVPLPPRDAAPPVAPGRTVRKRRSPWPMRVGILLLLAAGGFLLARGMKRPPLVVETTLVERGAVRDEISSSSAGEVLPARAATVRAEVAGRAMDVRRERGARVKKGDVVVALDAADLAARLKQAEATVATQRAQLVKSEAQAEAAARASERARRLAERGAETAQTADDAAAQAREAQAALQAMRAQLEESRAAVEVARVARARAALTAPFDGLIADVFVNAGDAVQVGERVFELVDDSQLHVEATIDESDIGRVQVGQPATVKLDALPGRPIAGRVSKLDPTVRKDEKGARTLRLEVTVESLAEAVEAGIRPGMSANVDVRVAEKQDVLHVPTSVVIGRGTKRSLYVVDNGVVRERSIQIGMSSWERTEVVSGVSEGDVVVSTLNVKGLADGAAVQVKPLGAAP